MLCDCIGHNIAWALFGKPMPLDTGSVPPVSGIGTDSSREPIFTIRRSVRSTLDLPGVGGEVQWCRAPKTAPQGDGWLSGSLLVPRCILPFAFHHVYNRWRTSQLSDLAHRVSSLFGQNRPDLSCGRMCFIRGNSVQQRLVGHSSAAQDTGWLVSLKLEARQV